MDDLTRTLGFDPQQVLADADKLLANLQRLGDGAAGLVGKAESADGRISVEFSDQDAVRSLTIDPRALRMGAEELADVIVAVIREARVDLEAQGCDLLGEPPAEESVLSDPVAAQEAKENAMKILGMSVQDSMELVERLRGLIGR